MPYFDRKMALIHLRSLTRQILEAKHDSGALVQLLETFAPDSVRGDVVPTVAEGYHAVLDLVNREGGAQAKKETEPTALLRAGSAKLRIFVQRLNEATGQWEDVK